MKTITTLLSVLLLTTIGYTQPGKDKFRDFEKFKALKISFMTEKLELNPEEAQQF